MQSVSFRIWIRIVASNSYDDNHYTTGNSIYKPVKIHLKIDLVLYPAKAEGLVNMIIGFPKGISAMWNAIILVQDLNSCRRVHFLRR